MSSQVNSIAVLGAGAMGALFGGLLSEVGFRVSLIDVNDVHIAAISQLGLQLSTDSGDRQVRLPAGRAAAFDRQVDVLLVFTKAYHTAAAIASARHLVGPNTWIVTLQNGLGAGERIADDNTRQRIAVGMTNWPAELLGPGRVASHGSGEVRLWSLSGKSDAVLSAIAEALSRAGLNCCLDPDVQVAIWEKAAFNAAMNALAAVTGMRVGQMSDCAQVREIAKAVVAEAVATARAVGINVQELRIWAAIEHAYASHRDHSASMLQDLRAGRPTEIDAINGAIVLRADELGIDVPVTRTLMRLVHALESVRL